MIRWLALLVLLPAVALADDIRTLTHDGMERRYLIDRPTTPGPHPVALVLHGGGGDASGAREMTDFSAKATARGMIVVYPFGAQPPRGLRLGTWNAGECCGYALKSKVDDIGFLAAVIDHVLAEEIADSERVYLTGLSNGAMMTHRAAAALSDRLAAIAPVIGTVFGDEIAPPKPLPALIVTGAQDRIIPPAGGRPPAVIRTAVAQHDLPPADAQSAFWAAANGCDPKPARETFADGAVTRLVFACPDGGDVIHVFVNDGGHSWPGGRKLRPRGDEPSRSFDATTAIIDFFLSHD